MKHKSMIKKGLLLCALFAMGSVLFIRSDAPHAAQATSAYALLEKHQVMDNYMSDLVEETAQRLVRAAGRWPGVSINSPHGTDHIHIFIVDSGRFPKRENILYGTGINLLRNNIQGGALCHVDSKNIFIDSQLLKDFISHTFMVYYHEMDGLDAAAMLRIKGVDAFSPLWNPAQNSSLSSRAYREKWLIAFRGMLGFVIGHEIGHLALGEQDIDTGRPVRFSSKEDMDARWACPELVDAGHRKKQQMERRADDFSMNLLARFKFPDSLQPQRLLYEIGAHSYFSYELQKTLVNALFHTSSRNIHAVMQMRLGHGVYSQLVALDDIRDTGSVQIIFPNYHPAVVNRIQYSLGLLAKSPYSAYYGEDFGIDPQLSMLNYSLRQECGRLSALSGQHR